MVASKLVGDLRLLRATFKEQHLQMDLGELNLLYVGAAAAFGAAMLWAATTHYRCWRRRQRLQRRNSHRRRMADEKAYQDTPTAPFITPTPPPYPNWSLTSTKPLPYRPFRYGPTYFITMGLRKLPFADWIELDNEFLSYHAQKAARITSRGDRCCRTAPAAMPAALELLDEFARYLPARYPALYAWEGTGESESMVEESAGGEEEEEENAEKMLGERRTRVLLNLATGERFDLDGLTEDPMATAARLVQDDLALMVPCPVSSSSPSNGEELGGGGGGEASEAEYRLLAGATLLTGFWRLEDKFGQTLDEIHRSGDVPGYDTKLRRGMNNFLRRLRSDEMVARNNYFVQVDGDLAWSESIGSEDQKGFGWFSAEKDKPVDQIHFRSERQSLRRLPKSGAIVFTIRTYFCPVTQLATEPYVPGRLASAIRSWDDDVATYKGRDRYETVLLDFLDREHQRQLDEGLDLDKEDEVRKYPW